MGYIDCPDIFIPEAEPVIAYDDIDGMFRNDLFQPQMFGNYMVKKYRDFQKKYNILREKP